MISGVLMWMLMEHDKQMKEMGFNSIEEMEEVLGPIIPPSEETEKKEEDK